MSETYEDIRRLLRQAIIRNIESHEVGGERLAFSRDVGRQWFHDNEGQAVFTWLKARLEDSVRVLKQDGVTEEKLLIHATALRLDCLANMHASDDSAAIFTEEFRLSPWYQSTKHAMDAADELSDREFADVNTHLLLQEACYMLELPGFIQVEGTSRVQDPLERRLAAVEASNRRLRTFGVVTLVGIVVLGGVTVSTARHWTKVDVQEHPETFRNEVYRTGEFRVTDNHRNPCAVGQSWTGCIDEMSDEYQNACVSPGKGGYGNGELSKWAVLTPRSRRVCDRYAAEIERMKQIGAAYVATLGNYGRLSSRPTTATRKVSNKDQRAAVTHEAVCYLGFIGECR